MNGTKTPEPSVYGTLGTPAANNMPGNRSSAVSWTDNKGNLWLFGGNGSDSLGKYGFLNDLWEYSPVTNQWVWMSGNSILNGSMGAGIYIGAGISGTLGTPAAGNIPEGRSDAVGWTDAKGNLWLFGGYNYGSSNSYFNDLWEFNPSTNQWVWMSGSKADSCSNCYQPGVYGTLGTAAAGNVPGSRMDAVSWTDSKGNLWLFGGNGVDSNGVLGALNDFWEFNPSTNQWTWMGGSNTTPKCGTADCGQSGVYGTLGIPAAGNIPGARYSASGWSDSKGNFWLWGGSGFDSAGNDGSLNDLWEFNPSTNEWTWMSGISTYPANCSSSLAGSCGLYGAYGTLGMSSAGNIPGARQGAASWIDSKGNLWLFGGHGFDATGRWGYLDDLWVYSPSINEWAWMSGSSTVSCPYMYCGQPGVYGTLQTPALGNNPSSREHAVSWTDASGNLWLFGGIGINVVGTWNSFQDLWEFQPNTGGSLPLTATPTFSPDSGATYTTVQTVTINDTTPGAMIYYLISGNTPASVYTARYKSLRRRPSKPSLEQADTRTAQWRQQRTQFTLPPWPRRLSARHPEHTPRLRRSRSATRPLERRSITQRMKRCRRRVRLFIAVQSAFRRRKPFWPSPLPTVPLIAR